MPAMPQTIDSADTPASAGMASKQLRLASILQTKMLVGQPGGHTPTRRAVKKTDLNQKRLINFFQGVRLFRQCGCQRTQTYGAATVLLNNGEQQSAVNFIKAVLVYLKKSGAGF